MLPTRRGMLAFAQDRMTVWDFKGRRRGVLPGCTPPQPLGDLLQASRYERHVAIYTQEQQQQEPAATGEQGSELPGAADGGNRPGEGMCSLGIVDLQRCGWMARACTGRSGGGSSNSRGWSDWVGKAGGEEAQHALQHITSLYFDEVRRVIFTGTEDGRVHMWSC